MMAIHPRLSHPGDRSTIDDHMPPEALAYKMQDPQWCLKQSEEVGPNCNQLIKTLFSDKVLDNLRAAQGIISMGKKYSYSRLEAACGRALDFDNPRYRTVKIILEKGLDQQPSQIEAFDFLSEVYRGKGRFTRDTKELLN